MAVPQFHAEPLQFVRPGTLVDVGVNIGYHFSRFVTFPNCHIVGYEPQRILFNSLCQEMNEIHGGVQWPEWIELHNVALSNFIGRTEIRVPVVAGHLAHPGGSITKPFEATETTEGYKIELLTHWVQVTTLDSQKLENITYLKIDAEGAEEEIIQGGAETITHWKPPINIELEHVHRANCLEDVPKLLYGFGYEGFFVCEDKIMNFANFDRSKHQVCESDGVGASRRQDPYVFDFQFIHKDDSWSRDRLKTIYGIVP
jgi:FkbM family methyltransferase